MAIPTRVSLDRLDDAALARQVATGDQAALELLMRRNNQRLYRAARSILKDDADAEEAVQDAYLKAYHAIGSYQGGARLSTWLTRIAINEALTRSRKHARRAEIIQFVDVDPALTDPAGVDHMHANHQESPEVAAQRADVRRVVERHIDQLPAAFRSVFVLRAVEDMSVEETAQCLDLPPATVRTRYFRARGLLREALARDIDLSMDTAFSFAGERCDRIVASVLASVAAGEETPR